MKDIQEIKEKLNTKVLGKNIIYLKEVRLYTRLYKDDFK